MKKIFENLLTGLGYTVLSGLILWGYGGGMYHAFEKHGIGDGVVSVFVPPWTFYRSIEFFWHDDFADVDWEVRLSNDLENCIYLLNYSTSEDVNTIELNNYSEKFSLEIKKYPKDKFEHLKFGTKVYIKYDSSIAVDLKDSFLNYYETGQFEYKKSNYTINLANQLEKYNLSDQIEITENSMDLLMGEIKDQSENLESKEFLKNNRKFVEMLNFRSRLILKTLKSTYFKIFNEEY